MQKLKKLLFGADTPDRNLPSDVRSALQAWLALPGPNLDQVHFHTRYVVVDVATSGLNVEEDRLLGIAGLVLERGGAIVPDQAFAFDLASTGEDGDVLDRRLTAFLRLVGHAPLVTYQAPFVGAFLKRLFEERLGLHFQPDWIDLAWLLPDLFKERMDGLVPMDAWLETFAIQVPGRRDPLADSVALARLLQLALPRAAERGADTPGKLIDIGRARRWLRHSG